MSRSVRAGIVAFGQVDIYSAPGNFIRVAGVPASSLSLVTFVNGSCLPWILTDGSSVPDSLVAVGRVYFSEVVGAAGYYLVRFFPDRVGFWRIVLRYNNVDYILEFDAAASNPAPSGLNASFAR